MAPILAPHTNALPRVPTMRRGRPSRHLLQLMLVVSLTFLTSCGGGAVGGSAPSAGVGGGGGGGGQLTLSPSSINFGDTAVGASKTQSVTLTNSGTGSVTISDVDVTSPFSLSSSLLLTLNAGEQTTFSVTFSPTTGGSASDSLSLTSDATNTPTVLSLSGNGVVPIAHEVDLFWDASTSPDVVGYNVYRGTQAGGPYTKINQSLVVITSFTDTTVQSGTTFFYVATARDTNGVESVFSNEATAVVPLP